MREAELLNALAQTNGGVHVYMSRQGVLIKARYAPHAIGEGNTLMDAAINCAKQLLDEAKKYPSLANEHCPDVLKALKEYDRHSRMLQV